MCVYGVENKVRAILPLMVIGLHYFLTWNSSARKYSLTNKGLWFKRKTDRLAQTGLWLAWPRLTSMLLRVIRLWEKRYSPRGLVFKNSSWRSAPVRVVRGMTLRANTTGFLSIQSATSRTYTICRGGMFKALASDRLARVNSELSTFTLKRPGAKFFRFRVSEPLSNSQLRQGVGKRLWGMGFRANQGCWRKADEKDNDILTRLIMCRRTMQYQYG